MARYTIVTMFRDRDVIGTVQQELRNSGVDLHDGQMLDRDQGDVESELVRRRVDGGDIRHYMRGVEKGYPLLVGTVDEADLQRAVDILDNHGPVDMRDGAGLGAGDADTVTDRTAFASGGQTSDTGLSAAASGLRDVNESADIDRRTGTAEQEEVIPIAEEELRIGKRAVERGGVRVRSYVVETPVEESVRLRDETVHVDRRAVDPNRQATDADFQERVVELRETDEEAVVSKQTQVTGEVVVRKDVEEREKTISDTVRRTEVDIDKGPVR
ncbi:YsnF/AvaK domain-containing protein [Skermanella sp. TT6]|uniref:YsnF/AvaK domain-containing protein n=1 Tax=Skermanella cutis TaxID=2775420 RepID=A0ABX7B0U7_9PROT|nr:YsnF/AvaK domain-containing protein [Skermanella sp. TT6]QQP87284.1 YsnF/AvaK domain-containing protein [Skermanella sp. TT6]